MDFSVLVFITSFMSYCWTKASPSDHRKDASPLVQRFFILYLIMNNNINGYFMKICYFVCLVYTLHLRLSRHIFYLKNCYYTVNCKVI